MGENVSHPERILSRSGYLTKLSARSPAKNPARNSASDFAKAKKLCKGFLEQAVPRPFPEGR